MSGSASDPSLPHQVDIINPDGSSELILVCEHASNFIPSTFGNLGLDEAALTSHIAWDIGALAVARDLSARLDAPLIAASISRLIYDCNRPPEAPTAIPECSEVYPIPGNRGLTGAQKQSRIEQVYVPFHDVLCRTIDERFRAGRPTILVTIHSFTPVFHGRRRLVEVGFLHDRDSRLADALLWSCAEEEDFVVRRNEPYGPADGVTHTLKEHALQPGLLNVMIELRNDLIADAAGQQKLTAWLAAHLCTAVASLTPRS